MALFEFPLPDVGEGFTEAEIVSWKVAPGDQVSINQVVCEIETAKSLVELPSPFEGTVEALACPGGRHRVGGHRPSLLFAMGHPTSPPTRRHSHHRRATLRQRFRRLRRSPKTLSVMALGRVKLRPGVAGMPRRRLSSPLNPHCRREDSAAGECSRFGEASGAKAR
jgi:hypothetical protein